MIRQALESKGIHLSNSEFAIVLKMVTDDIKFNRVSFKKRTNLNCVLDIAVASAAVLKKCA